MSSNISRWILLIGILFCVFSFWPRSTASNTASAAGDLSSIQRISDYQVDMTPDTELKYQSNGETAIFSFTVQNTGTIVDSYSLSLADVDWPTVLSTNSVGPLAPNAKAAFQISVTVPLKAVSYSFDQAAITAQSALSATLSDTSVFTTETIANYWMYMEPRSDERTDNPGETVTYTLTIFNGGNVTDTYDLTHTVSAWPVSFSKAAMGPLAPWSDESFEVYVTIPGGASNGAQEAVTVTADSQSSYIFANTLLTTTATSEAVVRGVKISPPTASDKGNPGDVVWYSLTVTNTSSVRDTIHLELDGNVWDTNISKTFVSLPSLGSDSVFVNVTIPTTATFGMRDRVTVYARATGASDASVLTTAVPTYIFLPTVMSSFP